MSGKLRLYQAYHFLPRLQIPSVLELPDCFYKSLISVHAFYPVHLTYYMLLQNVNSFIVHNINILV